MKKKNPRLTFSIKEDLRNFAVFFCRNKTKEDEIFTKYKTVIDLIAAYVNKGFPSYHQAILRYYDCEKSLNSVKFAFNGAEISFALSGKFKDEMDRVSYRYPSRTKEEEATIRRTFWLDILIDEHRNEGYGIPDVIINPRVSDTAHNYPVLLDFESFGLVRSLQSCVEKYRNDSLKKVEKYFKIIDWAKTASDILEYWPAAEKRLRPYMQPQEIMVIKPLNDDEMRQLLSERK